jgi:hypothetical protein
MAIGCDLNFVTPWAAGVNRLGLHLGWRGMGRCVRLRGGAGGVRAALRTVAAGWETVTGLAEAQNLAAAGSGILTNARKVSVVQLLVEKLHLLI